ncbi:hypothetical protein BCR37DRAFT_391091 [Protomyces lactucae-debilis]|uniref:Uncharacterized protein n=1 Tax=Protomyces lactucae-debilis TaxID=2754530 RepID=A0A1Y2FRT2_PROLT|nr:uncharacterized protein BCR37DRAFT_391091 [Protomyces lactucae-debilis]ORY86297.1 hypothetical protein BCR37DRAFT_391091 [Protomyces lactucae-debilis]
MEMNQLTGLSFGRYPNPGLTSVTVTFMMSKVPDELLCMMSRAGTIWKRLGSCYTVREGFEINVEDVLYDDRANVGNTILRTAWVILTLCGMDEEIDFEAVLPNSYYTAAEGPLGPRYVDGRITTAPTSALVFTGRLLKEPEPGMMYTCLNVTHSVVVETLRGQLDRNLSYYESIAQGY